MIGLTLELMKRGAMLTVLSSLVTAIAWPAALLLTGTVLLLKMAYSVLLFS